jgi:hypothetical protein
LRSTQAVGVSRRGSLLFSVKSSYDSLPRRIDGATITSRRGRSDHLRRKPPDRALFGSGRWNGHDDIASRCSRRIPSADGATMTSCAYHHVRDRQIVYWWTDSSAAERQFFVSTLTTGDSCALSHFSPLFSYECRAHGRSTTEGPQPAGHSALTPFQGPASLPSARVVRINQAAKALAEGTGRGRRVKDTEVHRAIRA